MEQALITVSVVSMLVVIATGAVTVVAVRGLRRRYRSARARLRSVQVPRLRATGAVAAATVGSPGWWQVQNRRHRMWRAVSSAEHAVAVAGRSDVVLGDLLALTSQLGAAAQAVDAVLQASARLGSLREEDRVNCDRIEAAAADIHFAAMSSLRSASQADIDPLVSAVQMEVAALAWGARASRR